MEMWERHPNIVSFDSRSDALIDSTFSYIFTTHDVLWKTKQAGGLSQHQNIATTNQPMGCCLGGQQPQPWTSRAPGYLFVGPNQQKNRYRPNQKSARAVVPIHPGLRLPTVRF